jgi:hypothetical protein
MTVKELIEVLQTVEDQDTRIMVGGYEGGYNELITQANNIQDIALNVNAEWYYGAHEKVDVVYGGDLDKYQIVKAIIL